MDNFERFRLTLKLQRLSALCFDFTVSLLSPYQPDTLLDAHARYLLQHARTVVKILEQSGIVEEVE